MIISLWENVILLVVKKKVYINFDSYLISIYHYCHNKHNQYIKNTEREKNHKITGIPNL